MTDGPAFELRKIFLSLSDKCNADIEKYTKSDVKELEKCKKRCRALLEQEDILKNGKPLSHIFQEYAQIVFDYTYYDECKLVEEEFPESSSRERIQTIFDCLDEIVDLTKRLNPDKQVVDVLGSEITECLYWRKGALLYMYCSTMQENEDRVKKSRQDYLQNLHDGIFNLKLMLEARGKTSGETTTDTINDDPMSLINVGVYSDTHLLAMMYAGEMCYWYCKDQSSRETTQSDSLDIKSTGVDMLTKYIQAVKGPLIGHGWSSERAELLLQHLST